MRISGAVRGPREGQAPPLRGECEAVRCRRRGGRPRPPVDMNEGWRNGPPGRRPLRMRSRGAVRGPREGQAPPLRRRVYLGAERTAGRRGRRPLRGGAKYQAWCESAGRRGRRRPRDDANIGRGCESAGGASPSPTGTDGRGAKPTRDVGDAVPYGAVRISSAGARWREGQAPPLRRRTNAGAGTGDTSSAPVYALGHLPLKGKASGTSRTPSPTVRGLTMFNGIKTARKRGRTSPCAFVLSYLLPEDADS